MQGEAGVDDVGRAPGVLVGQEPAADHLDVAQPERGDLGLEPAQHQRRDVDGDHPGARRRDRDGELARARPQLDDERLPRQAQLHEERDLVGQTWPASRFSRPA
jgi:hypothetical protein